MKKLYWVGFAIYIISVIKMATFQVKIEDFCSGKVKIETVIKDMRSYSFDEYITRSELTR